jgi:predicted permease
LRQLLAETIVLGGCAAVVSVTLTQLLAPRVAQALTDFPLADTFTADWRVFAVTFVVALAAGIAAGLSPAAEALRFRTSSAQVIVGRGETGPVSRRLSGALIANQVSISLALLIAVGLIARTQAHLLDTRVSADAAGTVITSIDLTRAGYSGAAARRFYDRLLPMLEAMPGIRAAALSSPPPFAPIPPYAIRLGGGTGPAMLATFRAVSRDYFTVMNIRLLRGRLFTQQEEQAPQPVMPIVVSQSFVTRFLPNADGLGGRIRYGNGDPGEIVGVVATTSSIRPAQEDDALVYSPIYAANVARVTAIVQASEDARPVLQAIRAQVRAIDPKLLARPETVSAAIAREAQQYSGVIRIISVPAGLAVLLLLVGVYGLAAFAAVHRTREIGIRIAVGATTGDILWLFARSLRRPLAVGVLSGSLLAAVGLALLKRTPIAPAVAIGDPVPYGAAIVLLIATAVGATLVPALRAARMPPWSALTRE